MPTITIEFDDDEAGPYSIVFGKMPEFVIFDPPDPGEEDEPEEEKPSPLKAVGGDAA